MFNHTLIASCNQKGCFKGLLISVRRLSRAFSIAGYRGRRQAKSAVTDDEAGSKPGPFLTFCVSKILRNSVSIATGNRKLCFFSDLLIHVHRLLWAFSIAGYRGGWQAKSAVTDDEPGTKRLRNSVFDCNWQSKMQFLRLIDTSSSTIRSTCYLPAIRAGGNRKLPWQTMNADQ